jgi:predicted DNA-binding transcriptional regulator YafY
MNRTDRLVAMVMLLQSQRVITAAQMAAHFEITERTVYRDLASLGESGVPVVGEAGVGYSLMRGYHLPPVMFSTEEAFALVTGGLLAERMSDASMRESIRSSLGKITAVLPAALQDRINRLRRTMVVQEGSPTKGAVPLNVVQSAIAEGCLLRLLYHGAARGESTERIVEPLGLVFYLDYWHLIAWCRLRDDVRDFRVDRIMQCATVAEFLVPRADFDLTDHLARCMRPDHGETALLELPTLLMERVRRTWGPVILAEQVNGSQTRLTLSFRESDADYFGHWLLSMGTQVTILAPATLRDKVAALAQATTAHHQKKSLPLKHS